ncbi:MAG TPA: hypothetical protein VHJ40_08360 [Actinomycetota bacterium]|nr:hypothetical protein [Actinomycetota bacterium]
MSLESTEAALNLGDQSRLSASALGLSRVRANLAHVLLVASAAWAVIGSLLMFPLLSDNNDEAVYLFQAAALRDGVLFPQAPSAWEAFLPWLSAYADGRFVPKYTPVHAAIIAIAGFLFRTDRAALAIIAAGAVGSAYLLAQQILGNRRQAFLAGVFFSLSPLFLVQSTLFLSYLSALAILQGFAAALIVGLRRSSRAMLVVSGLLLGLAIFARAFDALLFSLPLVVWMVWRGRSAPGQLIRHSGWVLIGLAVPIGGMLTFFKAATGSPFASPFFLDALDIFGFGERRMVPDWESTTYTASQALQGMSRHLLLSSFWVFGGLALIGLAISGARGVKKGEPALWLGALAVTVPAGYFFFWGSYGSIAWGGPGRFGPFYYLPVLTPIAILGARGFDRLLSWDRKIAAWTLVGMIGLSALVVVISARQNAPFTAERRKLYGPLMEANLKNALVFLPQLQGPWLMQPFGLARNDARYKGDVVWALDRGHDRNLTVLSEFHHRQPYRLVAEGSHRGARPSLNFTTRLESLRVVRGSRVTLDLIVRNRPLGPLRLDVTTGLRSESFEVAPTAIGTHLRLPLTLTVGSTELGGPITRLSTEVADDPDEDLEIRCLVPKEKGGWREVDDHHLDIDYRGQQIQILLPAETPEIEGEGEVEVLVAPQASQAT